MPDNDYDAFAAAYDADNESNAFNAYYERPAILRLAGNCRGLRVLDAGCGGGLHALALLDAGATVTCIDSSASMLSIAERRLAGRARLLQADLSEPLAFEDQSFDLVLASLVMHYMQDWGACLQEFHRLLAPRGRLVLSTHHPFMDHMGSGHDDYFATYDFSETWSRGGREISMRFWHRPLHAMVDALMSSGFQITAIQEPQPLPEAQALFPKAFRTLATKPRFIFFAAERSPTP